ncbi:MAG: pirin family protein [Candidatus Eiseniibacteriota bacterium]
MITIRPRDQRGTAKIGWLDSKHTFSFGHYHDPAQMGFRALRVINEDRVIPGAGFPTHGHRDMEIISYVLDGALAHKDSTGNAETIRPGDVQRMTAGTGVRHSEFNASDQEPVHFLQIWILPEQDGLAPGYEQRAFSDAEKRGRLRLVASRDGRDGSVTVHQDVALYATVLAPDDKVAYDLKPGRHAWVQVARGQVTLNGELLKEGDGAAISQVERLELQGATDAEVLLFDLA